MAKNGEFVNFTLHIISEWYMCGRSLNIPIKALNKQKREWIEELERLIALPEDETIISIDTFSDKSIVDVEEDI